MYLFLLRFIVLVMFMDWGPLSVLENTQSSIIGHIFLLLHYLYCLLMKHWLKWQENTVKRIYFICNRNNTLVSYSRYGKTLDFCFSVKTSISSNNVHVDSTGVPIHKRSYYLHKMKILFLFFQSMYSLFIFSSSYLWQDYMTMLNSDGNKIRFCLISDLKGKAY